MIISIIRHELHQIVYNRKTWFCLAAIHALMAIIFNWLIVSFLKNQALVENAHFGITEQVVHPFYAWFSLIVLIFIPMISTQALCAEKISKTYVNYQCAPITAAQVIIAKFVSISIILLFVLTSLSIMPLSIISSGSLDWGQYTTSILGAYLMLNAALAIGLGISTFMNSIARSNLIIFLILMSFVLLEWAAQYTGPSAVFLQTFGLLNPLKNFLAGLLSLQNLAYYLLIICSFLSLAAWRFNRECYHA
jgi:ABC-2 type transport system permease protein